MYRISFKSDVRANEQKQNPHPHPHPWHRPTVWDQGLGGQRKTSWLKGPPQRSTGVHTGAVLLPGNSGITESWDGTFSPSTHGLSPFRWTPQEVWPLYLPSLGTHPAWAAFLSLLRSSQILPVAPDSLTSQTLGNRDWPWAPHHAQADQFLSPGPGN